MASNPYGGNQRGSTQDRFPGPLSCPPKDEPSRIIAFLDTICDHETPGRRELETEWAESKAFVEGHHWLDNPSNKPWGQAREFVEKDQSLSALPLTVTNEIYAMVDTERSRLGKRRSQPYVRPRRGDQGSAKVAAAKADDIIDADMDRVRWPMKYRDWVTDTVNFGTGVMTLEQASDFRKATKVGVLGAQKCKTCRFTSAAPELPPEAIPALGVDKLMRLMPVDTVTKGIYNRGYRLKGQCLACGDEMEPWQLGHEDAAGADFFKRPLGKDIPYGDTMLRNRSPWELFVENEGVGLRPGPMGEPGHPNWFCEDYAAPIEEVRSYYEQAKDLIPDQPIDLARQYPMLGVYSNAGFGWRGVTDRTVYHNHVRMRRYTQGPTLDYPLGRMIDMAGNGAATGGRTNNSILVDSELFVRSKDDKDLLVPRRSIHAWRFFPMMNSWWGQGLPTPLKSPQRRVDMTFSQVVWNRETNGNNGLLITPGMRVTNPGFNTRLPGNYAVWYPDPRNPTKEPIQIQGRLMDPNVWQEIDYTIKRMQYIAGIMDVDVGQPTGGVTAAIAIEMLASKSSERRDMREQEGIDGCKDIWRNSLMMKREFMPEGEERPYMARGTGDVWVKKQFRGADLKGQSDIVVDEEPSHDVKAYGRQIIIEGLDKMVVPIDTAYSRREVRKELGIRSDIAEGEDVQVEDAERKWHEFTVSLDERMTASGPPTPGEEPTEVEIPTIGITQDDHPTHFQIYGMQWKAEEGVQLLEDAEWKVVEPLLAGWRRDFDQQMAKRDAFEQVLLSGALEMAKANVEQSNAQVQAAQAQGVEPGVITASGVMAQPAEVQMVREFAEYVPPPEAIELHIEQIWLERLSENPDLFEPLDPALLPPPPMPDPMNPMAPPPPPPEMPPAELKEPLRWVLKMQAVTEAHNLYDEIRKQAAMAGAAMPAAPSAAVTTPAGTEPTPGQPVAA